MIENYGKYYFFIIKLCIIIYKISCGYTCLRLNLPLFLYGKGFINVLTRIIFERKYRGGINVMVVLFWKRWLPRIVIIITIIIVLRPPSHIAWGGASCVMPHAEVIALHTCHPFAETTSTKFLYSD